MPCARPYGYLGCATLFHGVEECGGLSVRLENDVFVATLVVVARRHIMAHVGRLADVAVGYRPADALSRRRGGARKLRGREVEVDGVALLPLEGRAGARDVGLQVDALVVERVDPFAGLVRVDDVDDGGFACGCSPATWSCAPRGRRVRSTDSAAVAGLASSAPRRELALIPPHGLACAWSFLRAYFND